MRLTVIVAVFGCALVWAGCAVGVEESCRTVCGPGGCWEECRESVTVEPVVPVVVSHSYGYNGPLDSDDDGLSDGSELNMGTDPFDPDSDGDGVLDGAEVFCGADPLDPYVSCY